MTIRLGGEKVAGSTSPLTKGNEEERESNIWKWVGGSMSHPEKYNDWTIVPKVPY